MRTLLILVVIVVLIGAVWFFQPGGYLIVNNPEKSDAIVVLAGDQADNRYWRGLELLRAGYGQHLLVDAGTGSVYGRPYTDLAANYIAQTAGASASQVSVCPVAGDSTKVEAPQVNKCLLKLQPAPHSVLLVTDNYHTRRAYSIFRDVLPQYHWRVAAASNDFFFGVPWWKHREWAKTYLTEWEKLVYWELWDRWRK